MARFKLIDVKNDKTIRKFNMCDIFMAEVQIENEDGESFFICNIETNRCPSIYLTKESMYENDSEDLDYFVNVYHESLYESNNYDYFFEHKNECGVYRDAVRYLAYIVRSEYKDTEKFIAQTKGKFLDEIEIPFRYTKDVLSCRTKC
ncbi:MAG: hypothetical protein MJZ72_10130 [Bacteroidales bacterium]|nr:hypothetical protein [Bacteroidales bacterium]